MTFIEILSCHPHHWTRLPGSIPNLPWSFKIPKRLKIHRVLSALGDVRMARACAVEGRSRPLRPTAHRSVPFSAILSPHSDPGLFGYLHSTIYPLSKRAKVLGHVVSGCVLTFAANSSQLERSTLVGQSDMRPRPPKVRIDHLLLLGYSRHSIGPLQPLESSMKVYSQQDSQCGTRILPRVST